MQNAPAAGPAGLYSNTIYPGAEYRHPVRGNHDERPLVFQNVRSVDAQGKEDGKLNHTCRPPGLLAGVNSIASLNDRFTHIG